MKALITKLSNTHDRNKFSCSVAMLDDYLHKQASQDIKRKLCVLFVLEENTRIKGYYTLSTNSIQKEEMPAAILKKMPPYPNFPTILLGRLAVDVEFKGKGFGEILLMDALQRSYHLSENSLGAIALIVDPIDKNAQRFYSKYGFILLPESQKMFLPMHTIKQLF